MIGSHRALKAAPGTPPRRIEQARERPGVAFGPEVDAQAGVLEALDELVQVGKPLWRRQVGGLVGEAESHVEIVERVTCSPHRAGKERVACEADLPVECKGEHPWTVPRRAKRLDSELARLDHLSMPDGLCTRDHLGWIEAEATGEDAGVG